MQTRVLLRRLRLRAAGIGIDVKLPKLRLGRGGLDTTAAAVCPDGLNADSVVYSFGVGTNLEWDLEMIRRFGVTVHGFDPSPGAIAWVRGSDLPAQFVFHAVGLAPRDGILRLYPPVSARTVHYSSIRRSRRVAETDAIEVPVKRLATIARELGHDRIDVLKIDIDGGEYEIIPDLIAAEPPVGQILLEFHHNFRTLSFRHTRDAVAALRSHGYGIFEISHRAREFSFIRRDRCQSFSS